MAIVTSQSRHTHQAAAWNKEKSAAKNTHYRFTFRFSIFLLVGLVFFRVFVWLFCFGFVFNPNIYLGASEENRTADFLIIPLKP